MDISKEGIEKAIAKHRKKREERENQKYCSDCGKAIKKTAKFCDKCGEKQ